MKTLYKITLFLALSVFAGNVFAQQTENGFELYEKKEYQKAVEALEKLVAADKNDRRARLYLGMSYAWLGKESKAFGAFAKAANIKPEKPGDNEIAVKITSKPSPRYTDEARMSSVQGTFKLAVEFGADGTIKSIVPFKILPGGLTKNCIDAAQKIKFEPATRNGKPVSSIEIVEYKFEIY